MYFLAVRRAARIYNPRAGLIRCVPAVNLLDCVAEMTIGQRVSQAGRAGSPPVARSNHQKSTTYKLAPSRFLAEITIVPKTCPSCVSNASRVFSFFERPLVILPPVTLWMVLLEVHCDRSVKAQCNVYAWSVHQVNRSLFRGKCMMRKFSFVTSSFPRSILVKDIAGHVRVTDDAFYTKSAGLRLISNDPPVRAAVLSNTGGKTSIDDQQQRIALRFVVAIIRKES